MHARTLLWLMLAAVGSLARAADFYWDGSDGTTWAATNSSGLTWWRAGGMSGAYSASLPGADDVCYHTKTNVTLLPTVDLGTSGHYATIHLGAGVRWGGSAAVGDNPVMVDGGTAVFGTASGNMVWRGPVTLVGNLTVVKAESSRSAIFYSPVTGTGSVFFANVGPAYLSSASNTFSGGLVLSNGATLYATSCGSGPIMLASRSLLKLNVNQNWVLNNDLSGFGTNLVWDGTRTLTLSGSTVTPGASNVPGTLAISGNLALTNSARVVITLGGSSSNSLLAVKGSLALNDASLELAFANGFVPGPDDAFAVLSYAGTAPGPFANDSHGVVTFSNGWQANVDYGAGSNGTTVAIGNLMRTTSGTGFRFR